MNSVYKQEAHEVEAGSKCNSGFLKRCTQPVHMIHMNNYDYSIDIIYDYRTLDTKAIVPDQSMIFDQ